MRLLFSTCLLAFTLTTPAFSAEEAPVKESKESTLQQQAVEHYAAIVYATYRDSHAAAVTLQEKIHAFLDTPTEETLTAAKEAWIAARVPYLQTEAYRFYEGPIDFVLVPEGEGPEARLNSWPLNEAYIDYVEGNPKAGIIQDSKVPLTKDTLSGKNQEKDEADVATGYHAIEFLLWGQDLSKDGPGARPVSDYVPGKDHNDRRRAYLKLVTELLVEDLAFLKDAWEPGKDSYADEFVTLPTETALTRIMTGMATLSGFELASERLATALDSGDQEDEHSCFSDTTTQDFIYNEQGVANLYFGTYGTLTGPGIYDVVKASSPKLADKLANKIRKAQSTISALPTPFDSGVLAAEEESPARQNAEEAVTLLQEQAELLQRAGTKLGLEVTIVTD